MAELERADAARLLGVPVDADPATVRRAFRLWAAVTHPDQGGSPEAFDRLCSARAVLLEQAPTADAGATNDDVVGDQRRATAPAPPPRRRWSQVLAPPSLPSALLATAFLVAALAGIAIATPWGLAIAALGATGVCVALSRGLLREPDHGHVIVCRAVVWAGVLSMQLVLAAALGVPLIEALPLMAVPFVAAIALVNPGAGLRLVNVR